MNGQPLRMEVDTGAAFSGSSKNTYQELFSTLPLQHSPVKLKTYSGESLPVFKSKTSFQHYPVKIVHKVSDKPLIIFITKTSIY